MRLADWFGPGPDRVEVDELAVILGFVLRPDLLHRQHAFAQQLPADRVAGAVVLHLLDVPTTPDAEDEPAVGEVVDAGDLLCQGDRVAFDDEADAGAEE